MNLPWWTLSPNPFSVVVYALLTLWGSGKLKDKPFNRLVDAAWVLGVIVLWGDFMWCAVCAIRYWGQVGVPNLVLCMDRNLLGILFLFLLSAEHYETGHVIWGRTVWLLWGVTALFLVLWFGLAPGLEWTHWVWAIKNDYPWTQVWRVFFVGHVLGRSLTALIYWKAWH